MVPDSYRDFFLAEAGASAALVGLLFVAMSVASERVVGDRPEIIEQARASSALTAFILPLALSLVALLPDSHLGIPAVIVSFAGLLFVAGTLRRYFSVQKTHRENPRGLIGLFGFTFVVAVVFAYGIVAIVAPDSVGPTSAIAGATIASILIGVDRAWALIGGHGRGRGTALRDLLKGEDPERR
jgi:di/tricarboxylate transporter